jgi:excisionase family DNA binding protein
MADLLGADGQVGGSKGGQPLQRATYTVDEAAALLGISRNTAYSLAESELGAIRLGKRLLIPRAALDRMLVLVGAA